MCEKYIFCNYLVLFGFYKKNFFFFNSQKDFPKMDIYKCPISDFTNEN